jgi:peptidyl-tRNA hydrolase
LHDAAALLFVHNSGETTGAYFGVLKVSDDVVVVVHDESSFSCRLDAGFHAF